MPQPVAHCEEEGRQAEAEVEEPHVQRVVVDEGEGEDREEPRAPVHRSQRVSHRHGKQNRVGGEQHLLRQRHGEETEDAVHQEEDEAVGQRLLVEHVILPQQPRVRPAELAQDEGQRLMPRAVLGRNEAKRPDQGHVQRQEDPEEKDLAGYRGTPAAGNSGRLGHEGGSYRRDGFSSASPLFSLSEMNATTKLYAAPALALLLAACSGAPQPVTPLPKAPARVTTKGAAPPPPPPPASPEKPADPRKTVKVASESAQDPHSYARPQEAAVDHLKLDLTVDFQARKLTGRASLRVKNKLGVDHLILDTRDL